MLTLFVDVGEKKRRERAIVLWYLNELSVVWPSGGEEVEKSLGGIHGNSGGCYFVLLYLHPHELDGSMARTSNLSYSPTSVLASTTPCQRYEHRSYSPANP